MQSSCRICGGVVLKSIDLGQQPRGNGFLLPRDVENELTFHLTMGLCGSCTMAQLQGEVPQELRYHDSYPYHASVSAVHREHFEGNARYFLEHELTGPDPFIVEIGSNDGVMLATIAQAGVRHLGVEPSKEVAELSMARGVRVLSEFFDETTATKIRLEHGPADVIFGANCIAHIAHLASVCRGVESLLGPDGVFVFEEPYFGAVVDNTAFDMIYDEHSFYFAVRSIKAMAERFGLELVNAEPLPLHGGTMRYTLGRPGMRTPAPAVAEFLEEERARGLGEHETLLRFSARVERIRDDLNALLARIRAEGHRVVGYGAPAKTTTVTNYCGIGPDQIPYVVDNTPAKQGRLVPGTHIPVLPPSAFHEDYPEYALLFAWNHAEEIMAKETAFRDRGGRWILYVPDVHVL
ncbi:class I SAM-dependent methyltransferase [Sphaerisporangium krabiense]|uniref:class I SAM-dependent methyltransferase n=1 Tax=Sphaerisporangium krabiense TaxID=763782 RepID=UPI0016210EAC|nr:class I SAM-dependent methyltransferase [Sphaerisporangium krabiense]